MDLLLLSSIDWRYDIRVGMTDYFDSSAFQEECAP